MADEVNVPELINEAKRILLEADAELKNLPVSVPRNEAITRREGIELRIRAAENLIEAVRAVSEGDEYADDLDGHDDLF